MEQQLPVYSRVQGLRRRLEATINSLRDIEHSTGLPPSEQVLLQAMFVQLLHRLMLPHEPSLKLPHACQNDLRSLYSTDSQMHPMSSKKMLLPPALQKYLHFLFRIARGASGGARVRVQHAIERGVA